MTCSYRTMFSVRSGVDKPTYYICGVTGSYGRRLRLQRSPQLRLMEQRSIRSKSAQPTALGLKGGHFITLDVTGWQLCRSLIFPKDARWSETRGRSSQEGRLCRQRRSASQVTALALAVVASDSEGEIAVARTQTSSYSPFTPSDTTFLAWHWFRGESCGVYGTPYRSIARPPT